VDGADCGRSGYLGTCGSAGGFELLWVPWGRIAAHHTNTTRPYAYPIDSYDAILAGGGSNAHVAATS
jgi:hypothetical protein